MSKVSIGQKCKVGIGESGKWGRQRWNCEGFTNVNIWMLKMACWIRCISLRKEASILKGRCKYALIFLDLWAGVNKTLPVIAPPVEVETDLPDSGISWRFSEVLLGFLRGEVGVMGVLSRNSECFNWENLKQELVCMQDLSCIDRSRYEGVLCHHIKGQKN